MAKKKETTKVEEPVVNEEVVIKEPSVVKEQPKVEAPKTKAKPSDTWEIKDRIYYLKGRRKPLSYMLKSAGIFYFDDSSDLLLNDYTLHVYLNQTL